jgi:hypothetical protein
MANNHQGFDPADHAPHPFDTSVSCRFAAAAKSPGFPFPYGLSFL